MNERIPRYSILIVTLLFIAASNANAQQSWDFRSPGSTIESLEGEGWEFKGKTISVNPETGLKLDDDQSDSQVAPTAILHLESIPAGSIKITAAPSGTIRTFGNMLLKDSANVTLAGLTFFAPSIIARPGSQEPINRTSEGVIANLGGENNDSFSPPATPEAPGMLEITWKDDLSYTLTFKSGEKEIYVEEGMLNGLPTELFFSAGFSTAVDRTLQILSVDIIKN